MRKEWAVQKGVYMKRDFTHELYGVDSAGSFYEAGWPDEVVEESGEIVMRVPLRELGGTKAVEGWLEVRVLSYANSLLRVVVRANERAKVAVLGPMFENLPECEPLRVEALPGGAGWAAVDRGGCRRVLMERPAVSERPWSDLLPNPNPSFNLTLFPDGETPVRWSATDHFFPAKVDAAALGVGLDVGGRVLSVGGALEVEPEECLSGTGERFAPMDLSGRTICLENEDAMGVNNTASYKNVPWVLSSRGYGLFIHTSLAAKVSLADHSTRSMQFAVPSEQMDLFFVGGGEPDNVLRNYRVLTGVPRPVPRWSLGIWMSRMTYFSSEEVEGITSRLRRESWPCDVIHLDTGWFAKDWVCEWEFGENFPYPGAFLARLREAGFRVSLWQNPNILRDCRWLNELEEKGYLGERIVDTATDGGESDFSDREVVGQIDFSNPGAVSWYQDKLRGLFALGAEAIKTDFGETINMRTRYHGYAAEELRNLYALLYQKAAADVTQAERGHSLIWARAGWAGCQRYPVHWGGDCASTWDGMAASLRGGLHFGLSGFSSWSHDVPGFHGLPEFMNTRPTDLLYLRWTQFACFTSHFRYHGTSEREPWHYASVAGQVKAWWRLRYALLPYIEQECEALRSTGRPYLAALCFEDSEDRLAWKCDDQFMSGRDILVAPIMNEAGARPVWLPQGDWVDIWTGERLTGRQWLPRVEHGEGTLPVYCRAGARIPICIDPIQHTDELETAARSELVMDADYKGLNKSPLAELAKGLV